MKILHLPTPVGGNAWGLAQGERALGLDSQVLVAADSFFQYPADIHLGLEKIESKGLRFLKRLKAFYSVRGKYDVFHFNSGSTLLHLPYHRSLYHLDLPFYPKKAKLFVTYNGCDARQKYPTMRRTSIAACHSADCYEGVCNSGARDTLRRLSIKKMGRHVNHVWALNPDLLHFLPKNKSSFLPYTVSSIDQPTAPLCLGKKLRVVHAPTNRAAKGSDLILAALEKLKEKYPERIEVLIVENIPHKQALSLYQGADLVIDQILIGWYGGFAVECMLMAKPVIARISIADLKFVPVQMANDLLDTVINADPQSIYEVVERCLHDPEFLMRRSRASLEYARKWHSPQYVASLTKEKYES